MKKSLIAVLVLVGLMLASAVYAADYYGTTKYGTYYESPRAVYGTSAPSMAYAPTDYYPDRYYYQSAPYEYTRNLYRYGVRAPTTVLEQPSYLGFYSRINSGAVAGQLCGILQNRFYDCAGGYFCSIKENYIGVCEKQATI